MAFPLCCLEDCRLKSDWPKHQVEMRGWGMDGETNVVQTNSHRPDHNVTPQERKTCCHLKMAEEAAFELVAKAEKKLKGGMFGNMFGNKKEDAIELLQEAANKFKQVSYDLRAAWRWLPMLRSGGRILLLSFPPFVF